MYKKKVLIFAGTFEGRQLAEFVDKKKYGANFADLCVATEYGETSLDNIGNINIVEGRLNRESIIEMIKKNQYGMVIDATHPYAIQATENIRTACISEDVSYYRIFREEETPDNDNIIQVDSIEQAVNVINQIQGKVLLTTGAKELLKYRDIVDFTHRVFARVLPMTASIEACQNAGILNRNIIAMQGPFTEMMNLAVMKQYNCKILVTKSTGTPGGFKDKIKLADEGYIIIVIKRPLEEKGYTVEQMCKEMEAYYEK